MKWKELYREADQEIWEVVSPWRVRHQCSFVFMLELRRKTGFSLPSEQIMICISIQVKLTCRVGNVRGMHLFESILNVSELLHRVHICQHVKMSMIAPTKAFVAFSEHTQENLSSFLVWSRDILVSLSPTLAMNALCSPRCL